MKFKRYKRAGRILSIFRNNYGFREPYQVLLDGTFCQMALDHKVDIQKQLPKYLGANCKLCTTQCVIDETQRLGKALYGAGFILKQFSIRQCNHANEDKDGGEDKDDKQGTKMEKKKRPVSAAQCLIETITHDNNANHYFIASQDKLLRRSVRSYVCPVLKLLNNTIILEHPPGVVIDRAREMQKLTTRVSEEQKSFINLLKNVELEKEKSDKGKKKKRRGPPNPNPLSCKKSKKVKLQNSKISTSGKEDDKISKTNNSRRRKRIKLPDHIRKVLNNAKLSQ